MSIKIKKSENKIIVLSPFNAQWTGEAKRLGGRWSPAEKAWVFDDRNEEYVREALKDIYGTDGEENTELVTLRIEWKKDGNQLREPITLEGRTIARAFGRDTGAKIGEGVVILSGAFGSSGSMKNWYTDVEAGTVVLVHDVPKSIAEKKISENSESSNRIYSIHKQETAVDVDALNEERARLIARIAVIDALIANNPHKTKVVISVPEELCDTAD